MVNEKETVKIEMVDNKYCNRCDSKVAKSELEEYSYQCFKCEEDLYEAETHSNLDIKEEIANQIVNGYSEGKKWHLEIEINVWENLNDEELKDIAKQIREGETSNYDPCGWTLHINDGLELYRNIEFDIEIPESFVCAGTLQDLLGDEFDENEISYRTWAWINKEKDFLVTLDKGNSWCEVLGLMIDSNVHIIHGTDIKTALTTALLNLQRKDFSPQYKIGQELITTEECYEGGYLHPKGTAVKVHSIKEDIIVEYTLQFGAQEKVTGGFLHQYLADFLIAKN